MNSTTQQSNERQENNMDADAARIEAQQKREAKSRKIAKWFSDARRSATISKMFAEARELHNMPDPSKARNRRFPIPR
jgi:hypothetical protein